MDDNASTSLFVYVYAFLFVQDQEACIRNPAKYRTGRHIQDLLVARNPFAQV